MNDPTSRLKYIVSSCAIILAIAHLLFPRVTIDAVTLGLLVIAILPWLSPLIKSVEIPGVGKIELQAVSRAGEEVTRGEPEQFVALNHVDDYAFLAIADRDPNLAIVGLRVEIEKTLRAMAKRKGLPSEVPLPRILDELTGTQVLKSSTASGLRDLISAGNRAAHGGTVEQSVAGWAMEYGPKILRLLDRKP